MGMQVNHWDRVKRWALIGAGLGLLVSITRTIGDGVISAEDAGRFNWWGILGRCGSFD